MAAMTCELHSWGGNKSCGNQGTCFIYASIIAFVHGWSRLHAHRETIYKYILQCPLEGVRGARDKMEFNYVERGAHLVSSSSSWAWSGGKNFTANLRIVCFGPVWDQWVLWQQKIDQPMARSFRNCHNGNNGLLKRTPWSLWSSLLEEAIISINYFRQALNWIFKMWCFGVSIS